MLTFLIIFPESNFYEDSVRVNKRAAMLELDSLPLEGSLLETLHSALKEKKHPPLAIY
jgi:hypothetical protein